MRILNTLTIGLIVGFLSYTIADVDKFVVNRRVPPWITMLGYVNTTVDDIEEFDRRMCGASGGSDTYDDHKKSREAFAECVNSIMMESHDEFTSAGGDMRHAEANGELYKGICRKMPKFENCVKNFTDSLKTCLDVSKHETADVVYNVITSGLHHMCENRGARVKVFFNDGGPECLSSKSLEAQLCGATTFFKYIKDHVPDGAAIGGLGTLHLLVPNVEICTVIDQFQTCFVGALKRCSNQEIANEIVNPLFDVASKAMTCDRLLGKSKASPANVVNALLVTASFLLMSLRFV